MSTWIAIYVWGFWPALLATLILCWRVGGAPSRAASLVYAIGVTAATLPLFFHSMFARFETATAIGDLLLLIALLVLAVRWPMWWMIALAAVQLVTFLGHVSRLMNPSLPRLAYALITGSGGYPALILLIAGAVIQRRTYGGLPRSSR